MPARYALKVIDDGPFQIIVPKPGEDSAGWAIPVQRMLTILKPLQALELSRRLALDESVFQHGLYYQSLEPLTFPTVRLFPATGDLIRPQRLEYGVKIGAGTGNAGDLWRFNGP